MKTKITILITIIIVLLLCGVACGGPTLCRNRLYRAAIDNTATTQGGVQISLTVTPLTMPVSAVCDSNSYPGMTVVEFTPDSNDETATFRFRIDFDPNACTDPNFIVLEWVYDVIDTIPAPPVEVVPFEPVD